MEQEKTMDRTCKTCGFYENDCPFIRGKFMPYPNIVCKDYTYSAMKQKDLESSKFSSDVVNYQSYKKGYFDGRKDEKEQMMKDAIETTMVEGSLSNPTFVKRKIIIVE